MFWVLDAVFETIKELVWEDGLIFKGKLFKAGITALKYVVVRKVCGAGTAANKYVVKKVKPGAGIAAIDFKRSFVIY